MSATEETRHVGHESGEPHPIGETSDCNLIGQGCLERAIAEEDRLHVRTPLERSEDEVGVLLGREACRYDDEGLGGLEVVASSELVLGCHLRHRVNPDRYDRGADANCGECCLRTDAAGDGLDREEAEGERCTAVGRLRAAVTREGDGPPYSESPEREREPEPMAVDDVGTQPDNGAAEISVERQATRATVEGVHAQNLDVGVEGCSTTHGDDRFVPGGDEAVCHRGHDALHAPTATVGQHEEDLH